MDLNATLCVDISGGKDSQAMLNMVTYWASQYDCYNQIILRHADLGRAEWKQTPAFVDNMAAQKDLPLVIVRRSDGKDLPAYIQARAEKLKGTGEPFWPSSKARYCTSDLKRAPLEKHSRNFQLTISAQGFRAEESEARANKPVLSLNKNITAKRLLNLDPVEAIHERKENERVGLTWYPIHHFVKSEVYVACGTSLEQLEARRALHKDGFTEHALRGWPCHPAYVFGNERLSCSLCILATVNDLQNGKDHNPEYYELLRSYEVEYDSTFKHKFSLEQLK